MDGAGFDLPAYLARVGCPGRAGATLETLTALQEAHNRAVPFENLDILLGRPIRLDLGSLQAKIVSAPRGGYCFEQNTLFQGALVALGFTVTPLAARVRAGVTSIRARTHMLLRIDLAEGPFLADVGFGGGGPVHPVPLEPGVEVRTGPFAHRLVREDDLWVLQGRSRQEGWSDQYAFTLEPQYPIDFEMANWFVSTHPQSAFVLNLTAQRSWPDRRLVLRNRELTVEDGAGRRTSAIDGPEHLLEVLATEFDLAFPPGTRFSRPEF